jgi:hypothetical protein
MKKTNKSNPLKTFNDNKAMAYKKASGTMKTFKKSLVKAQDGKAVGPLEKGTVEYLDAKYPGTALKFQGPYSNDYMDNQKERVAQTYDAFSWGTAADLEDTLRNREEAQIRSFKDDFNTGTGLSKDDASRYRKGGSIKKKPTMKNGGTVKKMQKGGPTYSEISNTRGVGIIKNKSTIGGGKKEKEKSYNLGYAGPSSAKVTVRKYDREGDLKSTRSRSTTPERVDKYVAKNESKISYKKGGATRKVTSIKRKK